MSKKTLIPLVFVTAILLAASVYSVFESQDSPQEKITQGKAPSPSATEKLESGVDETGGVAEDDGTPRISFPEDTHDFGKVARGAKLAYNFKVRNTGDAPLKIIEAKGG